MKSEFSLRKPLRIGVIGMSEGNGHPYSWSAIFNGFDPIHMADCGFPVIPEYLNKRKFPEDFLSDLGQVTSVYTQDVSISESIAKSSKIQNVCTSIEELINQVDCVLLARDDAENHPIFATKVLEAGLPIFIDKPLAYRVQDAQILLNMQKFENQIFTCSALRFAKEFTISNEVNNRIGLIESVEATISKSWEKYAIHIIEPSLALFPDKGRIVEILPKKVNSNRTEVKVCWEKGPIMNFTTTGSTPSPLEIILHGKNGSHAIRFEDTFHAFRASLSNFIGLICGKKQIIPRSETLEIISIIEQGL